MQNANLNPNICMDKENKNEGERISWHPAFFEAIQMELDEYGKDLEFIDEYRLTTEPLRIDVMIIKKARDITIKKNIATIFRNVNILEYKSPDEYVSVNDFHQVYGYACLYCSLKNIDIRYITLTFVESRYPRELIRYLEKVRGYTVEEKQPGIYNVNGDILPIQIIDSHKLSGEENLWLKNLDNKLDAPKLWRITEEIRRQSNVARIKAYLDVITRANMESLQEVVKMSKSTLTLEKIFEEAGLIAKWEARAREEERAESHAKLITSARNLKALGISTDIIAKSLDLSPEEIAALS